MDYDLVIIGAGWAGINAAQRAKALGLNVVIIEKDKIGGTCLNRGCIPAKSLFYSAKLYALAQKSKIFGIDVSTQQINFSQIQARKERITGQLLRGLEALLKGIDMISGEARILSHNTIQVNDRKLNAGSILIACGSRPSELKELKFDGLKIISSDEILGLKELPASLLVVGGGVIGCEFAGIFSKLGTRVSIVEKMPQLLPGEDKETARKLEVIFKKKGVTVNTNADAGKIDFKNYDLVLACVGRTPNTDGLGLEQLGMKLERGRIFTDEYLRTSISDIYAAGDCTGKIMLAHYAAYQGRIAAENIADPCRLKQCDYSGVPSAIFTDPEIASVGLNEDNAKAQGMDIVINKFDFLGSGMARILDETEGFIKIISERDTNRIIGASIIGPHATELIAILTLAVSARLQTQQIKDTIFAHPTLSESIHEALK
ncbi:MAG: dihydrolipoyl dehydrogenase [Candidatus Omnitrophota bacterium]